jgi:type IV pilus assembly protein PilZ
MLEFAPVRESRSFPRLPVHLQVRYQSGAELADSFIDSLSSGGVFIRTSQPLPIGTDLVMEISIAGSGSEPEPIRIRGKVVWERLVGREDGMGVSFSEPPPDRLKKLLTADPS